MLGLAIGLSAVLGLLVGSFLNVVIHRVPAGESVVRPRSRCPQCGTEIAARDNIPVISWLVLRAKCRSCGAPISARYPAVEALTAILFAAVAAKVGLEWELPGFLVFTAGVIALAVIDLDTFRLPTPIIWVTGLLGLVLLAAASALDDGYADLREALLGAAISFAVLLVIHLASPRGMGFGDVRLAALLGLFVGWTELPNVGVALFAAFLLASVVGITLMLAGRRGRKDRLPFGPFLVAGAFVALFAGSNLLDLYLGR